MAGPSPRHNSALSDGVPMWDERRWEWKLLAGCLFSLLGKSCLLLGL